MCHSTTLPAMLATSVSRRAFVKRIVVMGAAIPVMGSFLAACGSDDADDDAPAAASDTEPTATAASDTATEAPAAEPTSTGTDATTPAGAATAAALPTSLASATQPPSTAGSGQLAFFGLPEGASASAIYFVGSDGAGLEAIWTWETDGSHAVALVWSPAGRHLAFYGHDAGTESVGLYVLDTDQGSVTRLHEGDFYGLPTWSPDGSQVYISVPRTSAVVDGGILAVPTDGSAPAWLISLQELDTHIPTMRVSPDGQKIAAPVGRGGPPQLAVMSVGDPQTRVVVGDDLFIDGDPVWSPDSRQIAFIGLHPLPTPDQPNSYGQGQLYVVNADGTGLSQLTDNWPSNPVWSPDGQQIAYSMSQTSTPETAQSDVYVSSVDGSQTRNLSNDPEYVDTGPSWSPDGREVAFVSQPVDDWRDPANASGGTVIMDIRVVMADGTSLRTVVAGVQFEHYMELIGRPDW